jgi:putative membrane protein
MNFIIKIMISTLAVLITSMLLPGVTIEENSFLTALLVALVLAFLNSVLKPALIFFTIPITVVTLGLFLIVINAGIILLADKLVDGFHVKNFWWALLFSIILSIVSSVFESIKRNDDRKNGLNEDEF